MDVDAPAELQAAVWVDALWGEGRGHFHFAFGVGGHLTAAGKYAHERWQERFGRWPDDRDRFLADAMERSERDDVYVAPYLRSNASRRKGSALASSWLYGDLDDAANGQLRTPAGVLLLGPGGLLINSGRGRHVYVRLPEEREPDELERLNRHLAFALGADSGWAENKVLRLPGTWNHKGRAAGGESLPVHFLDFRPAVKDWTVSELVSQLGPAPIDVGGNDADAIEPVMPASAQAQLLERLEEEPGDRSTQSFAFVAACLDTGLSDGETLALVLRHRPTREKYGERARGEVERSIRKLRAGLASPSPSPSRPRPQVSPSPVPSPSRGRDGDGTSSQPRPDEETTPSSWQPIDLVARAARAPEPPEIVGLLYPGSNHLVSGESEALKTWLALIAAVEELAVGRGVLWVDGDDVGAGALLERLRLLGAEDEAIRGRFAYVLPEEPLGNHRDEVLEVVRARACRLAVLDGLNALLVLHGLDPDRGTDVERFYRLIDPIRKAPTAVVLTDNVVKAKDARGAWAIGSERKKSKAEVHLGLTTLRPLVRGGSGRARIDVHKDRPGHLQRPSPGVLVLSSGDRRYSWSLEPDRSRGEEGEFRPTKLMERVSTYLELRPEPASRTQIEKDVQGKAEFLRVAIDCLIGEGYATEFEGPHAARLVRLEQRFREDEDAS